MRAPRPVHRCTTIDCPYHGQPTDRGCLCHRTPEQMLVEQRDELLSALKRIERKIDTASGSPHFTAGEHEVICRRIARIEGRAP